MKLRSSSVLVCCRMLKLDVNTISIMFNLKRQSAVLYRLLKKTIEAPKGRNWIVRVTNIYKEKEEKDDSE